MFLNGGERMLHGSPHPSKRTAAMRAAELTTNRPGDEAGMPSISRNPLGQHPVSNDAQVESTTKQYGTQARKVKSECLGALGLRN